LIGFDFGAGEKYIFHQIERRSPDMNRQLIILGLALLLLGCTDKGVEPETPSNSHPGREVGVYQPVVGLTFIEGTAPQEAEDLVNNLGLSFESPPTGTPLRAVVSVPVGTEDEWVLKFKTYRIVKSASRLYVVS
jgi:hypothetical protein